jgi:hypothetical protein
LAVEFLLVSICRPSKLMSFGDRAVRGRHAGRLHGHRRVRHRQLIYFRRALRAESWRLRRGETRSHLAGIWRSGQDSQAFAAWDGAGPYTITDNYLEAASETVMFGGAPL